MSSKKTALAVAPKTAGKAPKIVVKASAVSLESKEENAPAPAPAPVSAYRDDKSISYVSTLAGKSGVGIKAGTVKSSGVYEIGTKTAGKGARAVVGYSSGTPRLVRFYLFAAAAAAGVKTLPERFPAADFIKGSDLYSASPAASPLSKLYAAEIAKLPKPYNNRERVTGEFRGHVRAGRFLSFAFAPELYETDAKEYSLFVKALTAAK